MKLCVLLMTTLLAGCSVSTPHPTSDQIAVAQAQYDKAYAQNLKYLTANSADAKFAEWKANRAVQCKAHPRLLLCKPAKLQPYIEVNVVNNVVIVTK